MQALSPTKTDKKLTLTLKDSKDKTKDVKIKVKENKEDQLLGYSYGFYISGQEAKGLFGAIKYAFLKFFSTVEQMIFTVIFTVPTVLQAT